MRSPRPPFLERLAALRSAAGTDVDDLAEDALIRLGFVVAQSAARMDERTRAAIEADLITVRAALRAGGGS